VHPYLRQLGFQQPQALKRAFGADSSCTVLLFCSVGGSLYRPRLSRAEVCLVPAMLGSSAYRWAESWVASLFPVLVLSSSESQTPPFGTPAAILGASIMRGTQCHLEGRKTLIQILAWILTSYVTSTIAGFLACQMVAAVIYFCAIKTKPKLHTKTTTFILLKNPQCGGAPHCGSVG